MKPTSLRGTDAPNQQSAQLLKIVVHRLIAPQTDLANGGALATTRSRRGRRAVTDHNNEPVAVATYLKDG